MRLKNLFLTVFILFGVSESKASHYFSAYYSTYYTDIDGKFQNEFLKEAPVIAGHNLIYIEPLLNSFQIRLVHPYIQRDCNQSYLSSDLEPMSVSTTEVEFFGKKDIYKKFRVRVAVRFTEKACYGKQIRKASLLEQDLLSIPAWDKNKSVGYLIYVPWGFELEVMEFSKQL